MKKLLLFLLVLTLPLGACTPTRKSEEKTESEMQTEIENEEKPTELTVYGVGSLVLQYGEDRTKADKFFITMYEVGPFGPLTNAIKERGYMFYDPIKEFEEQTGIKINLQMFDSAMSMEMQIEEDGKKPDVVLIEYNGWLGATPHNNVYRWIYNNEFVDVMPYLELDQVYTNGEYYNEVLEAGTLGGKQYVLPLCFNMNGLFASKEDMNDLGVTIEQEMNSAEILNQLQQACAVAEEGKLVLDNLSTWSIPTTFVQDFWESTGCPVVDYETGKATVNRQIFEDMAECFKEYMQLNLAADWDTLLKNAEASLSDLYWNGYLSPGAVLSLDEAVSWSMRDSEMGIEYINQGVFFYENGTASSSMHSLPGQCVTLNTIYDNLKEDLVMVGMPMYEESDQYAAQVQEHGGILADTEYPYHCYQLLKFLMDQEYDPYYVIPVKKANAEAMLDQLNSTTYTLHLSFGATWGEDPDFSLDIDPFELQPLPENLKQQLQHMLDNIGSAVLPQQSIYVPLLWHMEAYMFGLETMDEAYENACADLEEHLEYIMAGDSPMLFYDGGYENFLLRGEDLRINKN